MRNSASSWLSALSWLITKITAVEFTVLKYYSYNKHIELQPQCMKHYKFDRYL